MIDFDNENFRHMTRDKPFCTSFEKVKGGNVTFGGGSVVSVKIKKLLP